MKNSSPTTRRLGLLLSLPVVLAIFAVISAVNSNTEKQVFAAEPANADAKNPTVKFNKDGELERPTMTTFSRSTIPFFVPPKSLRTKCVADVAGPGRQNRAGREPGERVVYGAWR
jgi:hypothetical protein